MPPDFSNQNLRGRNFKGQDLSGANFTNADIRGANFTNAVLRGANFTGAKAGVRKRWLFTQMILSFLLSAILNFVAVFLNALFIAFFWSEPFIENSSDYTFGIILILLIATSFFVIARQGLTIRAAGTIACVMALSMTFLVALLILGTLLGGNGGEASTLFVLIVAVASVSAVAVAGACTVAGGNRGAVLGVVAGAIPVLFIFASIGTVVNAVPFAVLLLGLYVVWRANKGDEKFALVRAFGMSLGAWGGTSFCGADLTAANFTGAKVKRANFKSTKQKSTILTDVCW